MDKTLLYLSHFKERETNSPECLKGGKSMAGFGFGEEIGIILVLFILLVIIACACD
jgi:hypothetical protein